MDDKLINETLVKEALQVLEEAINQYHRREPGINILEGLKNLYLRQNEFAKRCMNQAFLIWLSSGDLWKVDYAITLSSHLNIQENLPVLESLLNDIAQGKSSLPKYFAQFLEHAIWRLKSAIPK